MENAEQIELLTNSQREASQATVPAENEDDNEKVTVSKKRYLITVIILIIAIIGLVIGLVLAIVLGGASGEEKNSKPEICWTKECIGASSMIKRYQNPGVSPCDNFFEHVCGNFDQNLIEDNSWGYNQHKLLNFQIFATVRKTTKFDSKPNEQMRIFLEKCLDRKGMDSDNFKNLKIDIENRGGFPMIDKDWNEKKFDLSEMLAKYLSINRNRMGFLSVEPFTTFENGKRVVKVYLSPGPHWVYNFAMGLSKYKNAVAFVVERLLKLENRTMKEINFDEEYQKLIDLETRFSKLAQYELITVDTDNMSKVRNLTDLVKMIPEIDWIKILKALPRSGSDSKSVDEFLRKVSVHGGGDYFFGEKRELAKIATETPPKVLANYLVARQLVDVGMYFYDQDQPRQPKFYGYRDQKAFCASQLAMFFPMPSMNVFIKSTNFKMENLEIVKEMFKNVKSAYVKMFEENDYMEDEVRKFVIRKLENIEAKFGFDEYLEGKPLLEKLYKDLNFLESDSPFEVYMKMWRHRTEQFVEHVVDDSQLDPVNLRMFTAHAAYQPYHNHFSVMLPFLTYPYMDADFPASANYGYVGFVIGHEIGHAFDYFHRKIDEHGVVQNYWFTKSNKTNLEYERREKCLREQYSNYKEPGYDFFMNGTHCRYEIAGDYLGIQSALRAFKSLNTTDKFSLPGMTEFTETQQFFYNYALRQCDIYSPDQSSRSMLARYHPTNRFRVNGVVQNIPEFAEAFNCAENAKMNPENKCKLF